MKDIKFPARTRASMGDMPKEVAPPTAPVEEPPKKIQFKRLPNGAFMVHSANAAKVGTRVIHDATGVPLGVILNADVAEIICRAVTFLFHKVEQAEAAQAAAAAELTAAIPESMSDTSSSSQDSNQSGQPDSSITPPAPPPFVPLPDPLLPPLDPPVVNPDPSIPQNDPGLGNPSHDNPPPADPLNPPATPDIP